MCGDGIGRHIDMTRIVIGRVATYMVEVEVKNYI